MIPYVVFEIDFEDGGLNAWKEVLPFTDDRLALEEWKDIIKSRDWFDKLAFYKLIRVNPTSFVEIDEY